MTFCCLSGRRRTGDVLPSDSVETGDVTMTRVRTPTLALRRNNCLLPALLLLQV